MTIRLVGTCPVCERQQKVMPRGVMVHHGFQRPGVGHIFGDCFGVGLPAYELSSEGCRLWRDRCREKRTARTEALRELRALPDKIDVWLQSKREYKTYRRDAEDSQERYAYENAIRREIQSLEFSIKEIDMSINRMGVLIDNWQAAPLLEIDEEGFTPAKRAEREKRKDDRSAKRAEKERKKNEQQIKRNERLARKAATLLFFFDEFERLATLPPSKARDDYAKDLLFEAQKKKHGVDYPYHLWNGPDDGYGNHIPGPWGDAMRARAESTLVALGLAKHEPSPHCGRPFFTLYPPYCSRGNKIQVPEPGPADEVLAAVEYRGRLNRG
jgi:hypothetical protein